MRDSITAAAAAALVAVLNEVRAHFAARQARRERAVFLEDVQHGVHAGTPDVERQG